MLVVHPEARECSPSALVLVRSHASVGSDSPTEAILGLIIRTGCRSARGRTHTAAEHLAGLYTWPQASVRVPVLALHPALQLNGEPAARVQVVLAKQARPAPYKSIRVCPKPTRLA